MAIYCKGSVYVNYVYDFVKRFHGHGAAAGPAESLSVQEQSAAPHF